MKKITLLISVMFLLVSSVLAQDKPEMNKWRGLILDKTTFEMAVEILGEPKTDKSNQKFRPIKFNEWFDVKKKKDFRILHYEKQQSIKGFDDVKLIFRNDKLVAMRLEPKKLKANILPQTYGVEFEVLISGFDKSLNSKNYDRDNGKSNPRKFPSSYNVMHKAEKSYMFVFISNTSFSSLFGAEDDANSLPGKVKIIDLISKSLESREGTDLLN